MATDEFQRARSPEHKAARREAILEAGRRAALAQGGLRAVSLGDIAQAVGIHKSALLRYFATREEIYLELGARAWRDWADDLEGRLRALPAGSDADPEMFENRRSAAEIERLPVTVAELLAAAFAQRPLLCDLIPHAALNLERHATLDAIRAYKLSSLGSVGSVAAALGVPLGRLDDDARRELVSCAALLAGSMWQIAHPPPALAELYRCDPQLGHASIDFEPQLAARIATFIAGLAIRPGGRP